MKTFCYILYDSCCGHIFFVALPSQTPNSERLSNVEGIKFGKFKRSHDQVRGLIWALFYSGKMQHQVLSWQETSRYTPPVHLCVIREQTYVHYFNLH